MARQMPAFAAVKPGRAREPENGRFAFDGNLRRLCVCGHELGKHIYGGFECGTAPSLYPETKGCKCQKFRLSRKKQNR